MSSLGSSTRRASAASAASALAERRSRPPLNHILTHASHERRNITVTRPPRTTEPPATPRLVAGKGATQAKLTMTKAEQADYKELKANKARYEKEARVYDKLAHRPGRSEQDSRFDKAMASAARSQLHVLEMYEGRKAALKDQRKGLRAEADTRKVNKILASKSARPTAAKGSALEWARTHPDEVGKERGGFDLKTPVSDDEALRKIAAEHGFLAPPHSVTKSQMDLLINQHGAHEIWRGFSSRAREGEDQKTARARAKDYVKAFVKGPYYASFGTYGSGYYTNHGDGARASAHEYAGAMLGKYRGGAVMRAAVLPSARIGGLHEVNKAMQTEGNEYLRSHGITPKYKPGGDFISGQVEPGVKQLSPADRGEYLLRYGDVGRYAASKGYDVLGGDDSRYWIILNRGAVVAQRALQRPSKRVVQSGE